MNTLGVWAAIVVGHGQGDGVAAHVRAVVVHVREALEGERDH